MDALAVEAATRHWLEAAVIGLNLCPFAKAALQKEQIRFVVSSAQDPETLARELVVELQRLADSDPEQLETTLLVHPQVLQDFADFNEFLDVAEALARARSRLASFRADPARHARHAAKVLLKFHLLEEIERPLPALCAWFADAPLIDGMWQRLGAPAGSREAWCEQLVGELVAAQALVLRDGVVYNA